MPTTEPAAAAAEPEALAAAEIPAAENARDASSSRISSRTNSKAYGRASSRARGNRGGNRTAVSNRARASADNRPSNNKPSSGSCPRRRDSAGPT